MNLNPLTKIPAWKKSEARERVKDCLLFLHLHGIITDGERDKAVKRIMKWLRKERSHNEAV